MHKILTSIFITLFFNNTSTWAALEKPPTSIQGPSIFESSNKITWNHSNISPAVNSNQKTDNQKIQNLNKDKLVVVFMSASCPCSHSHNEEVQQLAKDFPDFDFLVIHSNPDEPIENSKDYFRQTKYEIPVLQDENLKWANIFHAKKTPHAFIITKDKVLYQGGVSSSNTFKNADKKLLRLALNEIKNGKSVSIPEGRTLGCAISRDDEED